MKNPNCFRMFVGILSAVALVSTAHAKKSFTGFDAFEGKYKAKGGSLFFIATSVPILASMTVKVPKSGKTATVLVNGFAVAGGVTAPVANTLVFTRKRVSVSNVVFSVFPTVVSGAGPASLSKSGNKVKYSVAVASSPTVPGTGSLSVRPLGKKKKKLTLNLAFSSGGSTISFQIIGVAKVRPGKEAETEKD